MTLKSSTHHLGIIVHTFLIGFCIKKNQLDIHSIFLKPKNQSANFILFIYLFWDGFGKYAHEGRIWARIVASINTMHESGILPYNVLRRVVGYGR